MNSFMSTFFKIKFIAFLFFIPFISHAFCESGFESSISQFGITWTFDKEYRCGQFANGDYWVLGPLTINEITPAYDFDFPTNSDQCVYPSIETCTSYPGSEYGITCPNVLGQDYCVYKKAKNGWMVNPSDVSKQGFDASVSSFDEGTVPTLPYSAGPNESIVKSVSYPNGSRPILKSLAVLTVLGEIPANNGADVFRPPYFGIDKAIISTNDINWGLLPTYSPSVAPPSIENFRAVTYFRGPQLDYLSNHLIDYLHPDDNMPNDGGALATRNGEIALRLMLDDSPESKKSLAIDYIQHGIDLYYAGINGAKWPPDGQIYIGRKLPMTFAAVMLDNQDMKNFVSGGDDFQFQENGVFHHTTQSDQSLWSMNKSTYANEWRYWDELVRTPDYGGKTGPDPYGYIDGSSVPGVTYLMSGNSMQSKKFSLALLLMPELRPVWNDQEILDFTQRWVSHGVWTQPDPCAPVTGICKAGTVSAGANCTMAGSYLCNHTEYSVSFGYTKMYDCDYLARESEDRGVKYGEDPDNPGHCISDNDPTDGIGRVPFAHGLFANSGQGISAWTEALWTDYGGLIENPINPTGLNVL